jgi:hypothetical protein
MRFVVPVVLAVTARPGDAGADAADASPPACAQAPDPSAELERTFREALRAYRPSVDAGANQSSGDQLRFAAREAERLLLPHGDLLRAHQRWALKRLPRRSLPDMRSWPRIPTRLPDDKDLAEVAAEVPLRGFEAASFRDPARAFELVRTMSAREPASWKRLLRAQRLEAIAPPDLVWANDDVERPVLALVEPREVFEIDFELDASSSSYLPKRITWARRPALPPAKAAPKTMEAALRAFTDDVDAYDVEGSTDGPTELTVKANAFAIERGLQLFAGHADALHARARCQLLERPRGTLPDVKSWRVVSHGDPPHTMPARSLVALPLLKWEPTRFFRSLRETSSWAVESAKAERRVMEDALAPPVVVRTNDDLDNPTLAVIDRDEAFVVSFQYDPSLPGYAPTDITWSRREAR